MAPAALIWVVFWTHSVPPSELGQLGLMTAVSQFVFFIFVIAFVLLFIRFVVLRSNSTTVAHFSQTIQRKFFFFFYTYVRCEQHARPENYRPVQVEHKPLVQA